MAIASVGSAAAVAHPAIHEGTSGKCCEIVCKTVCGYPPPPHTHCTGVGAWAFRDAGRGRPHWAEIQTLLQCEHCYREVMYDSECFGFVEMIGRHTHTAHEQHTTHTRAHTHSCCHGFTHLGPHPPGTNHQLPRYNLRAPPSWALAGRVPFPIGLHLVRVSGRTQRIALAAFPWGLWIGGWIWKGGVALTNGLGPHVAGPVKIFFGGGGPLEPPKIWL